MADTAYRVRQTVWLNTESERVGAVLRLPRLWGKAWTPNKLRKEMSDLGLDYTMVEINLVLTDLLARGVIDIVPEG